MKIKVPIPVKIVITQTYKDEKINEIYSSIHQLSNEIEQFQFQIKKLSNEAKKKGIDAVRIVQERIEYEQERRKEKINNLTEQMNQWEKLELGEEILSQTVEAEIDVKIGDSWNQLQTSQIIIKDGVIIEIRKGVKK